MGKNLVFFLLLILFINFYFPKVYGDLNPDTMFDINGSGRISDVIHRVVNACIDDSYEYTVAGCDNAPGVKNAIDSALSSFDSLYSANVRTELISAATAEELNTRYASFVDQGGYDHDPIIVQLKKIDGSLSITDVTNLFEGVVDIDVAIYQELNAIVAEDPYYSVDKDIHEYLHDENEELSFLPVVGSFNAPLKDAIHDILDNDPQYVGNLVSKGIDAMREMKFVLGGTNIYFSLIAPLSDLFLPDWNNNEPHNIGGCRPHLIVCTHLDPATDIAQIANGIYNTAFQSKEAASNNILGGLLVEIIDDVSRSSEQKQDAINDLIIFEFANLQTNDMLNIFYGDVTTWTLDFMHNYFHGSVAVTVDICITGDLLTIGTGCSEDADTYTFTIISIADTPNITTNIKENKDFVPVLEELEDIVITDDQGQYDEDFAEAIEVEYQKGFVDKIDDFKEIEVQDRDNSMDKSDAFEAIELQYQEYFSDEVDDAEEGEEDYQTEEIKDEDTQSKVKEKVEVKDELKKIDEGKNKQVPVLKIRGESGLPMQSSKLASDSIERLEVSLVETDVVKQKTVQLAQLAQSVFGEIDESLSDSFTSTLSTSDGKKGIEDQDVNHSDDCSTLYAEIAESIERSDSQYDKEKDVVNNAASNLFAHNENLVSSCSM